MTILRLAPFAAMLMLGGCAYDYADGYAPNYPPGYDQGMGSGQYVQPGDLFGGQNVASPDVFYEPLAQYGRWVDSQFGYGFQPNVDQGWRPYVNGRWGEDRLWISDDPWGWATDHYGRWGFDERIGWVWVPGTEWAPSWVAWREADDVTGWAPIPPGVSYSVGIGFGSGFGGYDNYNSWYGPSWVWVPRNYLYQPGFGGGILPWNNGSSYWRGSRWNYNSGWNGRPGYGNWSNRPGYGRPGGNRPDGPRPGYGRPGNNGQPGTTNPRPGGWNGQPRPGYQPGTNNPRPGYQPGTSNPRPGYQPGTSNPRPGYGRPDGTRPGYGRPDNAGQPGTTTPRPGGWNGQPRPGYQPGTTNPRPAYGRPDGQPNRGNNPGYGRGNGGGVAGQPRPAPAAVNVQPSAPVAAPPPRMERPQQQPRAQRPQPGSRENGPSNERPQ